MAPATIIDTEQLSLFPHGGWDTHHHIFDPDRFPYCENRHLTPAAATIQDFDDFRKKLGITQSVLTHGLSYGDDCTSLKAFLPQLGTRTPRAIGVIDPESTSDEEMRAMQAAGTRGIRVNLYRYAAMEDVKLQKKALAAHLKRVTQLSLPWSLTMTTIRTELWTELEPYVMETVVKAGVPLITDHFALLKAPSMLPPQFRADPTKQPGFEPIMRLVQNGHLWVKLSAPYRVSELKPGYEDLRFLVRAFVDANKHQVLWGSDWPHTPRMKVRTREEALAETPNMEVDDETWLQSLRLWLSDEEWDLLMVQNPSRLFG
ncbi:hypothetical protein B0T10DRAFT_581929 [Thelonectria olida]|uniref:Amidohydrolase-related domain-containing protein n=1 Tax=Thelonectria olida TaxID=1576542 RepID=A0A9P8VW33_9HYPO|nr:hypothetical protein B0T10DRAFT_581929 [Thelonectria olida]